MTRGPRRRSLRPKKPKAAPNLLRLPKAQDAVHLPKPKKIKVKISKPRKRA